MSPTQPTQPVAVLQVVMHPNGDIRTTFTGPDRNVFNMLLARAEQDMIPLMMKREAEAAQAIEVASPEARRLLVG